MTTDEGSDPGADGESATSAGTPNTGPSRVAVRRFVGIAGLIGGALLVIVVRIVLESNAEARAAEEAAADGRIDAQIVHLGHVARWRLPLASHDERAIADLLAIGRVQAERGEPGRAHALAAHREARRAILATRVWGVDDRHSFSEANRAIADLMAAETGDASDAERFLAQLEREPGPPPVGAKLAAFSFLAWIVASVGFVLRGLDGKGRLRPRAARRWGGASLALLVTWLVLMRWPELLG